MNCRASLQTKLVQLFRILLFFYFVRSVHWVVVDSKIIENKNNFYFSCSTHFVVGNNKMIFRCFVLVRSKRWARPEIMRENYASTCDMRTWFDFRSVNKTVATNINLLNKIMFKLTETIAQSTGECEMRLLWARVSIKMNLLHEFPFRIFFSRQKVRLFLIFSVLQFAAENEFFFGRKISMKS